MKNKLPNNPVEATATSRQFELELPSPPWMAYSVVKGTINVAGKTPKKKERPGVDRMGRTELHYAANEGDFAKVQELIAAGSMVAVADDNGWTPLHFAAQANSLSVANVLLAAGSPVDPLDTNGNSPLFCAVFSSRGSGDLIALLRRNGADPYLKNTAGQSPLGLARIIANYPVAQFFNDLPPTTNPA